MGIIYTGLTYLTRILWKKHLKSKMAEEGEHSLYIVTNENSAEDVIRNVRENNYNLYDINGLVIIDKDMTGSWISGIPVVAELKDASAYICQKWVDEVFINVDEDYPFPQELMDELLEMGMVVHRNLAKIKSMINKITGNKSPTPIPARILSPALCVTRPTIPGPMLPPRSPAIASKANIAVPPAGNLSDEILIVPGHIIPTEKPQIIHPIKPVIGFDETEASR